MMPPEILALEEKSYQLEDHLVVFIDFLGFSEITLAGDERALSKLVTQLRYIANHRRDQEVVLTPKLGLRLEESMLPNISTFSDHAVISYPLKELLELGPNEMNGALLYLKTFSANIAYSALELGLLIRGGATIGKLYHSDGVVFGRAMTEAYFLESRQAIQPRIIISDTILDLIPEPARDNVVPQDADGRRYLDYIYPWIFTRATGELGGYGPADRWAHDQQQSNLKNLKQLNAAGRTNEAQKWEWFCQKFSDGYQRWTALPKYL